jgi:hypothetical protein
MASSDIEIPARGRCDGVVMPHNRRAGRMFRILRHPLEIPHPAKVQ